MQRISKKQHLILIVITILVICSCNFIVNKDDNQTKSSIESKERIALDKEQANLLVNTSTTAIEVIGICNVVEKADINETEKEAIATLKKQQKEILSEIKTIAPSLMITVPSNVQERIDKLNIDKQKLSFEFNRMDTKVKKQKDLITQLNNKTQNDKVLDLTEDLLPIIDNNIQTLNELTILN